MGDNFDKAMGALQSLRSVCWFGGRVAVCVDLEERGPVVHSGPAAGVSDDGGHIGGECPHIGW